MNRASQVCALVLSWISYGCHALLVPDTSNPADQSVQHEAFVEELPGVARAEQITIEDTCRLSSRDLDRLKTATTVAIENTCDGDLTRFSGWRNGHMIINSNTLTDLEWPEHLAPKTIVITGRIRGVSREISPQRIEVYTTDFDTSMVDPEHLVDAVLWDEQYIDVCEPRKCKSLRSLEILGFLSRARFLELAKRMLDFDSVSLSLAESIAPGDFGLWRTQALRVSIPGIASLEQNGAPIELKIDELQVHCRKSACEGLNLLARNIAPSGLGTITVSGFIEPAEFTWDLTGINSVTFHEIMAPDTTLLVSSKADVTITDSVLSAVLISQMVEDAAP